MDVIKSKKIVKKIAILILVIMCANTIIPTNSIMAKSWNEGGGSLFQPIMDFLVFVADSVLNLLQHNFITLQDVVLPQETAAKSTGSFSLSWLTIGLIGIAAVTYGIATIATGGATVILTGVGFVLAGGLVATYSFGELGDLMAGEFDIPYIMYNPYAIFSGEIPAFDINFISPRESKTSETSPSINDNMLPVDVLNKLEVQYYERMLLGQYYNKSVYMSIDEHYNGWGQFVVEASDASYIAFDTEELTNELYIKNFLQSLKNNVNVWKYLVDMNLRDFGVIAERNRWTNEEKRRRNTNRKGNKY